MGGDTPLGTVPTTTKARYWKLERKRWYTKTKPSVLMGCVDWSAYKVHLHRVSTCE